MENLEHVISRLERVMSTIQKALMDELGGGNRRVIQKRVLVMESLPAVPQEASILRHYATQTTTFSIEL